MALDNYANFVRGSLTAAVDNSQTTYPVNNASIFPDTASGNYNLVVWDVGSHPRPDQDPDVEVVRVTGRDTGTDELTVTRGQEATTGVSHPSGSALHLSYTAKLAADIEADYVAEGENFDGQGTSQFTNLASVNADEVSRNIGHSIDAYVYQDGGSVFAVRENGTMVASRQDTRLLPVLDALLNDLGSAYVYIDGATYTVRDGDEFTTPINDLTLEFGANTVVDVLDSISGTTTADNHSYLIDFRHTNRQAEVHVFGNGSRVKARGNVDIPFVWADHRDSGLYFMEFADVTHAPFRFEDANAGESAQNVFVHNVAVFDTGTATPTYSGEFISVTEPNVRDLWAGSTSNGLYIEDCQRFDLDNVFNGSGRALTVNAVSGFVTGEWDNIHSELTTPDEVILIESNGGSVESVGKPSGRVYNHNYEQGVDWLKAEVNSGEINHVSAFLPAYAMDGSDADNLYKTAVGYGVTWDVWGVHRGGNVQNSIAAPADDVQFFNGLAYDYSTNVGNSPPAPKYQSGTLVELDSDGTIWLIGQTGTTVQLG